MLPFFRKIRYRLAKDNQFFKYSRYAIGEIVLVVVGILIALYINNWNEERKQREKFDQVLVEVEKELISNIRGCRKAIEDYHRTDSVVNRILFDSLTMNDFRRDTLFELSRFFRYYSRVTIKKNAFEKLLEISENISVQQDSIHERLKQLYIDALWGVETYDIQMLNLTSDVKNSYKRYNWFFDWIGFRSHSDDMDRFFLEDPEHKANVALFAQTGLWDHRQYLELFESMARKSYNEIHNYLSSSDTNHTDSLLFTYDPEDYKHYLGTYHTNWHSSPLVGLVRDSIEIRIQNQKLILTAYYPNRDNDTLEIIPVTKLYFRYDDGFGSHRLIFNENDEVVGLNYSQGISLIRHVKKR